MSTARDKALLTIKAVDIISVSAAPRKVMQGPLFPSNRLFHAHFNLK